MTTTLRRYLSNLLPPVFLLGSGVLLYAPVAGYDLLNLDDWTYTLANPIVAPGLSTSGLKDAFLSLRANAIWMPLTWLSYAADLTLARSLGLSPTALLHTANLLWHLLSACLLWCLLKRRIQANLLPLAITALWLVHPLQTEPVAWVACRKDLLTGVAFLSASLLWNGAEQRRRFVSIPLILGCLCKPTAAVLPLLVWLERTDLKGARLRPLIPACVASACTVAIGVAAQHLGQVPHTTGSLLGSLSAAGRYWLLPLLPIGLHAPMFKPIPLAWSWGLLVPVVLWIRGRWREAVAYLAPLLPVLGVVSIGFQQAADRYLYLPLLGVLAVASGWCGRWSRGVGIGCLVLACCAAFSTRNLLRHWRDDSTLTARAFCFEDRSNALLNRIAGLHCLCVRGLPREAAEHLAVAFREDPKGCERVRVYYGLALAASGRPGFALRALEPLIAPGAVAEHRRQTALAIVQANRGAALAHLGRALAARGDYPPACALMAAFALSHKGFGPEVWLERAGDCRGGMAFSPKGVAGLCLPWMAEESKESGGME
ncbi:MAG: hypothetical protein ACI4X9_06130 [Kiritimatiellia bacterium]